MATGSNSNPESGSQFNQYVSGGSAGALIYSNRTSNSLATYISGGSQTTGFTNSAGALIQLQGSGNPIGGLQLMAAYAVRNMPRWQGAWE